MFLKTLHYRGYQGGKAVQLAFQKGSVLPLEMAHYFSGIMLCDKGRCAACMRPF